MSSIHLETHRFQRVHDVASCFFPSIDRREVEVTPGIMGSSSGPVLVPLEQEELCLRPGHHREAHGLGLPGHSLQSQTGTTLERCSVRVVDVADEAGHALGVVSRAVSRKWENPKRAQIRTQHHVRLLDPHKTFDRRAVESDLTVNGLLELLIRHFHILVDAENVGELQPHETNSQPSGRF